MSFIVKGYDRLRRNARVFLCGHLGTHNIDKLQLAALRVNVASKILRELLAVEVEARRRMRSFPTQAIGQAEVDQLLHFRIRRARVRRPAKRGDSLASLDADQFVPELGAIVLTILRDDEGAEGSVDVECGFFIFHVYRIAQRTEKARDFFAIKKNIFCA
jgi:hypothetical protein